MISKVLSRQVTPVCTSQQQSSGSYRTASLENRNLVRNHVVVRTSCSTRSCTPSGRCDVHMSMLAQGKFVGLVTRGHAEPRGGPLWVPRGPQKVQKRTAAAKRSSSATDSGSFMLNGLPDTQPGSLIPQTLEEMEQDEEFQKTKRDLAEKGQKQLTVEERTRRRRALDKLGVPSFAQHLKKNDVDALMHKPSTILQVNIGLYCNQACSHCHVESSPLRSETMSEATVESLVRLLRASPSVQTLDITGGAPELAPQFRSLVTTARAMGLHVIDRCNLTVLTEPGQEDLSEFLAEQEVAVVASLPCYSAANVDGQRGRGVFDRSIAGLQELNARGYGRPGTGLQLDLMYNPSGGFLPPPEATLEAAYKQELHDAYGIEFSRLLTLTNMPIKRFADYLHRKGALEEYMQLLLDAFNPAAARGLMCQDLVSVRWDGRIFDCDFNQQLEVDPVRGALHLDDLESLDDLVGQHVATDNHCFGCTAGAGSSCSGSTS